MASDNVKWFVLLAIVLLYLSLTPNVLVDGTSNFKDLFNQPITLIFAALGILLFISMKEE